MERDRDICAAAILCSGNFASGGWSFVVGGQFSPGGHTSGGGREEVAGRGSRVGVVALGGGGDGERGWGREGGGIGWRGDFPDGRHGSRCDAVGWGVVEVQTI